MPLLQILLSSAVLVALIEFTSKNKSNNLQYVTSARSDWRNDMKQTACRLFQADREHVGEVFAELKVNLNGYGFFPSLKQYPDDKQLDFFKDEHIWKQIAYIEEKMYSWQDESFAREKNKVNEYITSLLKFDWERTKQEVKTKSTFLLFVVLYLGVHLPVLYQFQGDKNLVSQICEQLTPVTCIVLSLVSVSLPYVVNENKMFQFGKWYKCLTFHIGTWLLGIIVEVYGLYMLADGLPFADQVPYDITGFLAIVILTGLMFYVFGYKIMYRDYDRAVRRTMGCDTVICFNCQTGPVSDFLGFIINDFFAQLNLDFSERELPERIDDMIDLICSPDHKILEKPEHLLRTVSRIRFSFSREDDIKTFIKEKPKRCRFIFKYTSESKDHYAVGYNKQTKNKLRQWIYKDSGGNL